MSALSQLLEITGPPDHCRVIVGMSGGVDSSVSALLLKQAGYQVEGLFMKNWDEDDGTEYCTAKADLADASAVCDKLGIHLHTANFAAEYWDEVFEYFLAEYKAGRTPNPDILCNREIKFKVFLEYAELLGADFIATGHYVRTRRNTHTSLLRGLDTNKDQSYFLYAVSEQALAKTLFPVGELNKPEVRALAEEHGLVTHDKKDSTGICFIGERRFQDFLTQYIPARPGDIMSTDGRVIGHHQGSMYYTLGQRAGLGIGGLADHAEAPWYVADKDVNNNTLVAVQGNDHPLLFSQTLTADQLHWISGQPPQNSFRCSAKIRYRQKDQTCRVELGAGDSCQVSFDEAQRSVTPGQSVVFYQGETCLGGGVITANNTGAGALVAG
ncbi:MAG TPA: tRNA 2-thiouridine(34) synthase MnmA [Porticoccaceae bacterium]|nr:tRNA 2-thiouridine(34) synthase MnmA [Porticoccaceae bacterium]HCO59502.1 tRNA 2-thiouridine(34) synthase MnmA [Porticoccaceae bacterium]